jgi:GNAT superfamily N-acetyltransferase
VNLDAAREAIDANACGWLDVLARQPDVVRHDGWVVTDVPFSLCNSIVMPRWGDGADADARIDVVLAEGAARGVPQLWWTGETCTPPDLLERLSSRGVVADVEPMPGMALDLALLPDVSSTPVPARLRIEPVIDAAGLSAFAEPVGSAFGFTPEGLASVIAAFADFAASGASEDEIHHWVGFEGDRPVATASALVRDGVAGLYNVGTVGDARGRGYGAALTLAALRGAVSAGATLGILHSSPAGLGIYERLGFRTLSTVRSIETRAVGSGA